TGTQSGRGGNPRHPILRLVAHTLLYYNERVRLIGIRRLLGRLRSRNTTLWLTLPRRGGIIDIRLPVVRFRGPWIAIRRGNLRFFRKKRTRLDLSRKRF